MRQQRTCTEDGCDGPHLARGLCKKHYVQWQRTRPEYRAKEQEADRKRRQTEHRKAQERVRNRGRRDYQRQWSEARKDWGTWWERQRAIEDRRELRHWKPKVWPHCRVKDRPESRLFMGRVCVVCGAMWVSYETMPDTDHCAPCNRKRWKAGHRKRTRRYGGAYEYVTPRAIFERDRWRCQLCGIKTKGKAPQPRSPTLDHIIPLSLGGDHAPSNLQCACWSCNVSKSAGAANDQLRLAV